jgi:hypothetical protein
MLNFSTRLLWIFAGIFIIGLVLVMIPNVTLSLNEGVTIDWENLSMQFGLGLLIGLIPSLLIGLLSFKDQFDAQLKVLKINRNIINSGITDYFESWDESVIKDKLATAKNVDFYFTYSTRLIQNVAHILRERLKEDGFSISLFIIDKENPFIESLGFLWGKENANYNADGLKTKIDNTISELKTMVNNLKKEGGLKGNIKLYTLKYHPTFISFYKFDEEIVFVPTKIVETKLDKPPFFVCEKKSSGGIYNWCNSQLEVIKNKNHESLVDVTLYD